jgi:hypothetical protein
MKRISISPSVLDEFRCTMLGLWGKSDETLVAYLTGPREDSPAMARGRAYHLMLEHGPERFQYAYGDYGNIKFRFRVPDKESGQIFDFEPDAVKPIVDRASKYRAMLHEIKTKAVLEIGGYEVTMNMRLDALNGYAINEFKTTGTAPTHLKYFDALQWRCYLLALPDAQSVRYTVFHLSTNNDRCEVYEYQMHRDSCNLEIVEKWLSHFLSWLEDHPACLDRLMAKAAPVE